MRLKVKGRKKYVLTDILEDDVKEICTSLACEPALKVKLVIRNYAELLRGRPEIRRLYFRTV